MLLTKGPTDEASPGTSGRKMQTMGGWGTQFSSMVLIAWQVPITVYKLRDYVLVEVPIRVKAKG